ncbi:MAG: hypothetical protein ACPH9W_15830, partial [Pseudomonadales bacterium]
MEWLFGRYSALFYSLVSALSFGALILGQSHPPIYLYLLAGLFTASSAVGVFDYLQKGSALRANFPILGHLRYFFESIRPELRQYFW